VYNTTTMKEILSGIPNPIKVRMENCSSAKEL